MAEKRERRRTEETLEAYRRIRKAMPPPEKVERDRRRKIREEEARRELRDPS